MQIAFASQAVEGKLAMLSPSVGGEGIAPETLAMVRMIGGALFFQTAVLFSRAPRPRLGLETHARLAGLAALGVAANQALFLAGLRLSSPFVVSILGATIPVFAAALAVVFRKERASGRTALGVALAFIGVAWLTGVGSSAQGTEGRGALLVALNSLSYAAYVVFSRDKVLALGFLRFMAWVFTYGLLLFAPIGARELAASLPGITPRGWVLLAYIVVVPTILAYGLNAWALGRSSPTTVTIYIYLQPVLTAVLARVQLGYALSSRAWFAAALILSGVAVTTLGARRSLPTPRGVPSRQR